MSERAVAQNIYDDEAFHRGHATLPDLAGRTVLDLGCGFGAFARWAAGQGAAHPEWQDELHRPTFLLLSASAVACGAHGHEKDA